MSTTSAVSYAFSSAITKDSAIAGSYKVKYSGHNLEPKKRRNHTQLVDITDL
jgi:hypothetical protein